MTVLTDSFVEIDVPATPVRVFEPIQLELADHCVLQVVRVDYRISAQVGDFLVNVDVPTDLEGRELVECTRRAFDIATATVRSLEIALGDSTSTSFSLNIESGSKNTVISCTNNT